MGTRLFIIKALKRFYTPQCQLLPCEYRSQLSPKVHQACSAYLVSTMLPQMRRLTALTTNPVRDFHAFRHDQGGMADGQNKVFNPLSKQSIETAQFQAFRSGKIQRQNLSTRSMVQDTQKSIGFGPETSQGSKHCRKKSSKILAFGSLLGVFLNMNSRNDAPTNAQDGDSLSVLDSISETYINEAEVGGIHRCARKSGLIDQNNNSFSDFDEDFYLAKLNDFNETEPCDMTSKCLEPEFSSTSKPVLVSQEEQSKRKTHNICKTQDRRKVEGKPKKPGVITSATSQSSHESSSKNSKGKEKAAKRTQTTGTSAKHAQSEVATRYCTDCQLQDDDDEDIYCIL